MTQAAIETPPLDAVPFEEEPRRVTKKFVDAAFEEGGELLAEADQAPVVEEAPTPAVPDLPEPTPGKAPEWAKVPRNLRVPRGRSVFFLRFPAEWTDTPQKGDRQCILWSLNMGDEKMAYMRAQGDVNRAVWSKAFQTIRSVDGHVVDWSGTPGPGNVETWLDEIGERCRAMIFGFYVRMANLDTEQKKRFFESCVELRIVP